MTMDLGILHRDAVRNLEHALHQCAELHVRTLEDIADMDHSNGAITLLQVRIAEVRKAINDLGQFQVDVANRASEQRQARNAAQEEDAITDLIEHANRN